MRSLSNRSSPRRANYNTADRPSSAQDSSQDTPLNPAIADDQHAQEDLPVARIGQTESQVGSLIGDRETSQPASSVPATATDTADALSTEQGLGLTSAIRQFLAERQLEPSLLPALFRFIAGPTRFDERAEIDLDRLSGDYGDTPNAWRAAPTEAALPDDSLGQRVRTYMQRLPDDVASSSAAARPLQRPAVAGNPTLALSKALDLGPGFCESLKWQQLAKAQDLALLANLVTRALRDTENPNLKTMLRRLVEDMAAKPPFAKRVFVRLLGADESCGDHVSLGLSWAQEEWLAQPVWDGSLNHDLPKVIDIARQVFRRRFIEELAQQKVKDINKVRRAANLPEHTEDVETLLALLAGLHGPLELGGEKPDAEFIDFRISGVTLEDIEIAKRKVLEHESEHLWNFLATWEPWQSVVLLAHVPDEVAEIKKVLSDPDRPARLEREAAAEMEKANVDIESVPLKFREDHITRRANQLDHEEELQLWLALTRKAWSNRED